MAEKGRLGEILIGAGKLSQEQLEQGLEEQRQSGRPLGMALVRLGVLDEETLIRTLSKQLVLPMARLRGKRVSPDVIALVPRELVEEHHCCPLFVKEEAHGKVLFLGMEDATDLDAMDAVSRAAGLQVRPVLVATSEIDEALYRHYRDSGGEMAQPEPLPGPAGGAAADPLPAAAPIDEGALRSSKQMEAESPAPAAAADEPVSEGAILRALSQLLVEKGVISREELIERVHRYSQE